MNTDDAFAHLYALSYSSLGATAPNPNVSAAIYSLDGALIADGAHNARISPDHAEVVALKRAGSLAQGATLLVSLEPCNHTGKTPPCVEAIVSAGISRVIYAVADPNPIAAGGAVALRQAGVEVEYVFNKALAEVQGAWLHKIRTGRPYIMWKIATSMDGKIAARDGSSQWISSAESREDVQILRNQSDAILIGTGTALADNPTLRPRLENPNIPLRIVFGRRKIPDGFNLHDSMSETLFIQSNDLNELVEKISALPLNQLLVEAGPTLGTALMAHGLVDELVIYEAPLLLGEGKSWLGAIGVTTLNQAMKLNLVSVQESGPDLKKRYKREKDGHK